MRKVDQYAKDRQIGNGMSDKGNEESSRLCPQQAEYRSVS
jgi:hypothetical protein